MFMSRFIRTDYHAGQIFIPHRPHRAAAANLWPSPPIPFLLCTLLSDCFPHITFQTTVRDLGVTLDSALNFSQQNSQLNSLLLLPTEASENHSQSCIGSYFPLYYTCPWGPSIKYVTLFLANFDTPSPLSHFVTHLGPPPQSTSHLGTPP